MPVPPKPAYVKRLTDEQWRNLPLPERALHVARAQLDLGVREVTSNWGPAIRLYLAVVGLFTPAPWCAAFVTWCLLEAGAVRQKLPKLAASTYYWWLWAKQNGRLHTAPARGMGAVWNGKGGGHIMFVAQVLGNAIRTIEGNTDDKGGREGVKVAERQRFVSSFKSYPRWGFIDLTGLDS